MRRAGSVCLALAALFAASSIDAALRPAVAQESFSRKVRIACTSDARRLCPAYKLGTNEMRNCMEAKAKLISRGCMRALEDDGIVPRGMFARR